ncbi:unnamed protein product [Mycena citricolor]|uniref:Uncharacterized protein n=1 Tax=Mycena citricolor TaxID=2018698 RepID=A0AAD2JZH9_9AGAR|nr:unnamed protein product [Mycena citricolor]
MTRTPTWIPLISSRSHSRHSLVWRSRRLRNRCVVVCLHGQGSWSSRRSGGLCLVDRIHINLRIRRTAQQLGDHLMDNTRTPSCGIPDRSLRRVRHLSGVTPSLATRSNKTARSSGTTTRSTTASTRCRTKSNVVGSGART